MYNILRQAWSVDTKNTKYTIKQTEKDRHTKLIKFSWFIFIMIVIAMIIIITAICCVA